MPCPKRLGFADDGGEGLPFYPADQQLSNQLAGNLYGILQIKLWRQFFTRQAVTHPLLPPHKKTLPSCCVG